MQRLSPDRAQGPQYGHCFLIKHLTLSQPTHSYHTTKAPSLSLSFPPSLSLPPSLPPPPFLPLLPLPLHRPCSAHLVPITCLADHMSCTEREGGREGGRERETPLSGQARPRPQICHPPKRPKCPVSVHVTAPRVLFWDCRDRREGLANASNNVEYLQTRCRTAARRCARRGGWVYHWR